MKRCDSCDVFVESGDECPLCGASLINSSGEIDDTTTPPRATAAAVAPRVTTTDDEPDDPTTVRSARIWVFEMLSLVAFITGIIVLASDFAFGFVVTWSRYPLLAIGFVYLFVTAIIGFINAPLLLLVSETAVISLFLLGLDLMLPGDWFMSYAFPVTILVSIVTGIVVATSASAKLNRLQTLSVITLGAGAFVVGLEIVINRAAGSDSLVSWSLVALACCVSVSLLVLFINRRLRERHAEFRKIFHL